MVGLLMSAGFLFTANRRAVLLVQKNSPTWQTGLWNGIGGKAEYGEPLESCMPREFLEETALDVRNWQKFAVEDGPGYQVHFFRSFLPDNTLSHVPAYNDSGEKLSWMSLDIQSLSNQVVGNLRWLIPLALDWRGLREVPMFEFASDIKEKASW